MSEPGQEHPPTAERPGSIALAVKLMYVGATLSVLNILVTWWMRDAIKAEIENLFREGDQQVTQSTVDEIFMAEFESGLVFGVIAVGLWLWMALANRQGRIWARIVATVLAVFSSLWSTALIGVPGDTGISKALDVIGILLAIVIVVLLWKGESSAYYEALSRARGIRSPNPVQNGLGRSGRMKPGKRRYVWPRLFAAHAAIVTVLTTAAIAMMWSTPPEAGANIGAGLVALPLLPLGLPWSLPFLIDPYQFDALGPISWSVVAFGPAVLNVVLHGVVMAVARKRRERANPHH